MAKNAGNKLIFKDSEAAVASIMDSQKKEIAKLYEDWADEIGDRANFYSHKTTASAPLSERYYKELQKQLRETSQQVSNEVHGLIKNNMHLVSDAVVKDNVKWLEQFGFSQDGLNAAFSYVPDSVVRNLITGQIYESGWSLSSRIWSDNEQTLKDIYKIMAGGTAQQKSIYEISKDLEKYVRPSAAKPWNLVAADGRKIYPKQVDYNAQRLARTLTQHTYQQSFVAVTKNNPFITEYIWRANGSRRCELCAARDGTHYKKDELPLDHPNGMCIMEPVVADNMIDQLADWFNSPDGTFPEIDAFAGNFGYEAKETNALKKDVVSTAKNKIVNGTDISQSWQRRADKFDFEIDDVVDAQGFNGLPNVVSASEFDAAVKKSNFIAQRTYSAPSQDALDAYRNQLYNGKWYIDCSAGGSVYGKGMYGSYSLGTKVTEKMKQDMISYGSNLEFANVETFTLSEDAKIITSSELTNLQIEFSSNILRQLRKRGGYGNEEAVKWAEERSSLVSDSGTFAASLGYDAIIVDNGMDNYCIILNRTKVIFKGA